MTLWANRTGAAAKPFAPHKFDTKVTYSDVPTVLISAKAYNDMYILVDEADEEISWLGTVKMMGANFFIDEVFLLKQECSSVQTELDEGDIGDLGAELLLKENGMNIVNSLKFWGHSHVRMGTSPSGQDETQLKHFIDNDCEYFIRAILNKNGKMEFTVRWRNGIEIKDIPWMVLHDFNEAGRTKWVKEIKDKVSTKTYVNNYSQHSYNQKNQGFNNVYDNMHPSLPGTAAGGTTRGGRSGGRMLNSGHSNACQCIHCQMENSGVNPEEYMAGN